MTVAGARRALGRLAKTGFVEQLGGGRSRRFRIRGNSILTEQIVALFRAERDRYESLLSDLRAVLQELSEIRSAWISDTLTEVGHPLHINVLADKASLSYLDEQIRRRIVEIERRFDITIEVHARSTAESPEIDWNTATLLAGQSEVRQPRAVGNHTHSNRVARAKRWSMAIAEMLDQDPSLLRRAERHIDYMLAREQGPAAHDLREWKEILSFYSHERLKDFLVADTPRAERLRQSSPFFAVLTPAEREKLLDAAS